MTRERTCCDGRCIQGRACPLTAHLRCPAALQRLAPGVIDGPHRRPGLMHRARRMAAALVAQLWHAGGCR